MKKLFILMIGAVLAGTVGSVATGVYAKDAKQTTQAAGISADAFRANFNKTATKLGAPALKPFNYEREGSSKAFAVEMPSSLSIIGKVDQANNMQRVAVGLDVATVPRDELGDHSMMLGGFALTVIKAFDNNKLDDLRDDAVQGIYAALMADKKTLAGRNSKSTVYKQYKLDAFSDPKLGVVMIGVEYKK